MPLAAPAGLIHVSVPTQDTKQNREQEKNSVIEECANKALWIHSGLTVY